MDQCLGRVGLILFFPSLVCQFSCMHSTAHKHRRTHKPIRRRSSVEWTIRPDRCVCVCLAANMLFPKEKKTEIFSSVFSVWRPLDGPGSRLATSNCREAINSSMLYRRMHSVQFNPTMYVLLIIILYSNLWSKFSFISLAADFNFIFGMGVGTSVVCTGLLFEQWTIICLWILLFRSFLAFPFLFTW